MKIGLRRGAAPESDQTSSLVVLICLALALLTFCLYIGVLDYGFVDFDDGPYVTENRQVQQGVTPSAVIWAFTTDRASNWHPVTWLSHMVDCQFYGLDHPGGHHLTSLLFHIANSVLLFLLLLRMTGALWRGAVVAALFAWHPLHVESVAWIAERKDVLSTFFGLLTMLAYSRYVREFNAGGPKLKRYYCWTLVFFALGLMSKPMLVTLPFVLLLLDYWPLRRNAPGGAGSVETIGTTGIRREPWSRLLREKIPLIALSLISCVVTFLVQRKGGAVMAVEAFPVPLRLINVFVAYLAYLRKMIWPSDLAVFYPFPTSVPSLRFFMAVLLLALFTVAAIRLARSRPYVLVGWLWFLGTLVPVIGLVQVGSQALADRYMYIPSVGLFIVFVWGIADFFGPGGHDLSKPAWAILIPLLAACLVLTWNQLPYWQNSETLFRHDLEVTTNNVIGHLALGRTLDDASQTNEANAEFAAALKLQPHSPMTLNALGVHLAKQGELSNAVNYYLSALDKQPSYSDAHYNFGNVLVRQGKFAEAAGQYAEAVKYKPGYPDVHNNYGAVLLRLNRFQDALAEFNKALRLQPDYPEAQDQIGSVYLKLDQPAIALLHYAEAVRLKPDFIHARLKLGVLLAQQGDLQKAVAQFQAVLQYDPQNSDGYFNLAAAYEAIGQLDAAAKCFAEVIRLKPEDLPPRLRLAVNLDHQGKIAEAIQAYREALRVKADSPEALSGLAWLLATAAKPELRNGPEAVRLAEQANTLTARQQPFFLSALDAAYAEAGRFDDAIKTAQQVQQLATAANQKQLADQAAKRLELYRAGKPYHE